MLYLVSCLKDTESTKHYWWQEFHSKEDLERWLLYGKGHTIVRGIYKAEEIHPIPLTKDVKEVVGYTIPD